MAEGWPAEGSRPGGAREGSRVAKRAGFALERLIPEPWRTGWRVWKSRKADQRVLVDGRGAAK